MLVMLFTACDPSIEELGSASKTITAEQLSELVTFTQANKAGEAQADGNYFHFVVNNKSQIVHIFNYRSDGSKNLLASGFEGDFVIAPSRGSDPNVKVYIEAENIDGTEVVAEKQFVVYVPTEMSPEMKLMVSNSGKKIWKWNPDANGYAWGNGGYMTCTGDEFAAGTNVWWGCSGTDGFSGQLNHSDTGSLTGEEDLDAYMEMSEDGTITVYTKDGNVVRSGSFEIKNYTPGGIGDTKWSKGTLVTNSIMWPFKINTGGQKVSELDILKLTSDELVLACSVQGTVWSECTYWRFKSVSDGEGMLTNYSKKQWTWNPDEANGGRVWGNGCYKACTGEEFINGTQVWWGCSAEDLTGQLNHSDTGAATGEENSGAYMEFSDDGTIKTYDASGKVIREGTFSVKDFTGKRDDANWSLGTLETSAGAILFPFKINGGGMKPTEFDIIQLTADEMIIVYGGNGDYGECTYWRFKAK